MVSHVYNPITQRAKAGGLSVCSQPGLHCEALSLKDKTQKKKKKKSSFAP
jgi:hypothetical protein